MGASAPPPEIAAEPPRQHELRDDQAGVDQLCCLAGEPILPLRVDISGQLDDSGLPIATSNLLLLWNRAALRAWFPAWALVVHRPDLGAASASTRPSSARAPPDTVIIAAVKAALALALAAGSRPAPAAGAFEAGPSGTC